MAVIVSGNVSGHQRWKILARCTIHIPPTIISVALLLLNYYTIYFDDPGASHQNLLFNGLQFAAKVHEILIVASLSAVAINYIQYELVHSSGKGLSLGGVLAGFQLNNLSSVVNAGLWSKSLTKGFRVRRLLFALIVVFLMTMVAVVGPSSAILILPSIGWWPIPYEITNPGDPKLKKIQLQKFFASTNEHVLWPTIITLNGFMPSDCTFINTSTPRYCPAGGFSNIIAQAIENSNTAINISIPTISKSPEAVAVHSRVLEGIPQTCSRGSGTISDHCFISSTPASSVSNMLQTAMAYYKETQPVGQSALLRLALPNGTSFFGPQSFSVCSQSEKTVNTRYNPERIILDRQIHFPLIGKTDGWSTDGTTLFPFWNQTNWDAATWIDPPFLGSNTPSVSAAFISVEDPPYQHTIQIISCSVYANWVPRETYLVPSTGPFIYSPSILTSQTWKTIDTNHAHIKINADWANLALPPDKTIIPLVSKLNAFPVSKRQPLSPFERGRSVGRAISLVVTDAIARTENDVVLTGLPSTSSESYFSLTHNGYISSQNYRKFSFDIRNSTPLTMTMLQNGYSYSTDGITRRIALTTLLVHILVALVHTILLVGIGWESHRLRSLKDLFLLAANSPPAKASPTATSLYTVKVRKTSFSQLGIILDGHRKPAMELLKDEKRKPSNLFERLFR